ncbi:T9SS type A sorting domain-containing protein [Empedobacter brevis]|uniref:T9SS type A sorting domain-containing protein n=1 Tax=Empedobacter brevis TaxID=247 RepID=UPI0028A23D7E|nr:T9SS type A sorting domain-containing protein [Empedobacter brevis]
MKKFYKLLSLATVLSFASANAQIEFYYSTTTSTPIKDINDNGLATSTIRYFDYNTKTFTTAETNLGVRQLNTIINSGDITGNILIDGSTKNQPAFKAVNDNWTAIGWFPESDPARNTFTVFDQSENGKYIVGQMSLMNTDATKTQYGSFVYNTETKMLNPIFNTTYTALAIYTVNNEGMMAGWVDDSGLNGGTRRIPCTFDQDGNITYISDELPLVAVSDIRKMNKNGLMAGEWNGKPMIYDFTTKEKKVLTLPDDKFFVGALEDISDTGVAIGYAVTLNEYNQNVREAIIYHESFGIQVRFLKDYIIAEGGTINTSDGRLGTGLTISPNGKFMGGYDNSNIINAKGWVVKLNSSILGTNDQNSKTSAINVYPTLVSQTLNISSDKKIQNYTIINMNGITLKQATLNKTSDKIDVSNFSKGVYLIKIQSENNTKTVKFIKQ